MAGNYATMMIKCGRGEDTSGIIRRNKKHGKENKKVQTFTKHSTFKVCLLYETYLTSLCNHNL